MPFVILATLLTVGGFLLWLFVYLPIGVMSSLHFPGWLLLAGLVILGSWLMGE